MEGKTPEERSSRPHRQETELMDCEHARASRTLVARIMELHASGCTPEEIAKQVLTTEPENALFRAARLVETVLHYAQHCREEDTQ